MQSVPITTNVVSSNPVHGEMYKIMGYILSVTCSRSVLFPVSSTNKTDRHDIAEILLNMELNTIALGLHCQ